MLNLRILIMLPLVSLCVLGSIDANAGAPWQDDDKGKEEKNDNDSNDDKDNNNSNDFTIEKDGVKKVVLLGRSRSGKTALLQVLRNPCFVQDFPSLFPGANDARQRLITVDGSYLFALETPGFQEQSEIGDVIRSDEQLREQIQAELLQFYGNAETVDVLFTFSLNNGLNSSEIEALHLYRKMLKQITEAGKIAGFRFIFVMTHAEGNEETRLWENVTEFLQERRITQFAPTQDDDSRLTQGDFFFSGCLSEAVLPVRGRGFFFFENAEGHFYDIRHWRSLLLSELGFDTSGDKCIDGMAAALKGKKAQRAIELHNMAANESSELPIWSPEQHRVFSEPVRRQIETLLLIEFRNRKKIGTTPKVIRNLICKEIGAFSERCPYIRNRPQELVVFPSSENNLPIETMFQLERDGTFSQLTINNRVIEGDAQRQPNNNSQCPFGVFCAVTTVTSVAAVIVAAVLGGWLG